MITNIRHAAFTNDFFEQEKKHYVTLFLSADASDGEPAVKELDKCEGWGWYTWEEMPRPLFLPIEDLLQQGYHPFLS